MVETGESVICEDKMLYDKALDIYSKYIEKFGRLNTIENLSKQADENSKQVQSEYVTVKLDSLMQKEVQNHQRHTLQQYPTLVERPFRH